MDWKQKSKIFLSSNEYLTNNGVSFVFINKLLYTRAEFNCYFNFVLFYFKKYRDGLRNCYYFQ